MKKALIIILSILIVTSLMVGCSKKQEDIPVDQVDEVEIDETEEPDVVKEKKEGIPSPISGMYGPEEKVNRRPVAIVFDNHPKARWQAGLSQAEIVYEFLVEAPYSRYLGIYILNDPEHIGPVRSARPYFVTTTLEYDAVFVRVGGSEEAKADVKNLKVADVDGLYSGAFTRYTATGKTAPNNLYTTMERIRQEQKNKKFKEEGDFEAFIFNEDDEEIKGEKALEVLIEYNKNNTTKYVYDETNRVYKRYKDGKLHIDEYDNSEIIAKNIIIQQATTKVLDSVGRLSIDLINKGTGIYITNGNHHEITWEKTSRSGKTKYYNHQGEEIKLNPGVTWIQVIDNKTKITIE